METDRHQDASVPAPAKGGNWRRWVVIGIVTLAGFTGLSLVAAQSDDFGRGMMMHDSMGGGRGFSERRLNYILDAIKATPEQSEKIKAIVQKARDDIRSKREGFMDARDKMAEVLGAATINRAAAETIRTERIQVVDEVSKTLMTAMLDAAEVLTPEQRAQMLQHFKDRRAFGRW